MTVETFGSDGKRKFISNTEAAAPNQETIKHLILGNYTIKIDGKKYVPKRKDKADG